MIHIGLSERTGSTEDTVNTTLFNINANVIQQRSSILVSFILEIHVCVCVIVFSCT